MSHPYSAPEFFALRKPLESMGSDLTTAFTYMSQSNGVAERMNRSMMDRMRAMLREAVFNEGISAEAIRHAVYLHNKTVSSVLKMKTLQESLLGDAQNKEKIKMFRYAAYICTQNSRKATK